MLREGGTFVAKFFKGADLSYLDVMMKPLFKNVYVVKPESSRSSSAEAFVIGINFYATGEILEIPATLMDLDQNDEEDDSGAEQDDFN